MRISSRIVTFTATVMSVGGLALASSSIASHAQAAAGGYWARGCDAGRACIELSGGRQGPGGPWWNVDGCGYHTINDHYRRGSAHGNGFDVIYADGRWDRVQPWSTRPLDPGNLVTSVNVLC
ncbi:hypothetical protein ACFYY8_17070 [Streptosporangium sp. NPDC001559]|uniref:hypothetical protein n=1 Tax=Streptosporangium sp. NPDC001559 TaxID=3366187 RepID=UPI0036EC8FE0